MTLPDLLNLAIGLIVLYFLLSTICSIIVDLLARFTRYREELLTVTINSMIIGKKDKAWNVFSLSLDRIKNETQNYFLKGAQAEAQLLLPSDKKSSDGETDYSISERFVSRFWAHPEIKPLSSNYQDAPAAIPPETFARALVDLSLPRDLQGKLPQSKVAFCSRLDCDKDKLPQPIYEMLCRVGSSSDIPENAVGKRFWTPLYKRLERRYEDNMATTTDRFKSWTQKWLFIIGFIIACILNADTIQFIRVLSLNDEARASIATYAEKNFLVKNDATVSQDDKQGIESSAENESTAEGSTESDDEESAGKSTNAVETSEEEEPLDPDREELKQTLIHLKDLTQIGFPIGWNGFTNNLHPFILDDPQPKERDALSLLFALFLKLMGLLATALAINLGAPFWYGLLTKLMGTRQKAGLATPPADLTPKLDPKVAQVIESQEPTPLEITRDMSTPNNGFDARKAYWLAEASQLAYLDEVQIIRKVTKEWFLPKPFFRSISKGKVDTQVFAVATQTFVLIAFRGTEPKVIADIRTDADFTWSELEPHDESPAMKVHSGFLQGVEAVYDDLISYLDELDTDKGDDEKPKRQLHITGHSLGGALSLIFATKLSVDRYVEAIETSEQPEPVEEPDYSKIAHKDVFIYNFGCPRVGNTEFASYFDKVYSSRAIRIVNQDDIVTKVPPAILGFRHIGSMLHFKPFGKFAFDVPSVERFLELAITAAEDSKEATKKSLADHSMETYRQRCQDLTGAQVG